MLEGAAHFGVELDHASPSLFSRLGVDFELGLDLVGGQLPTGPGFSDTPTTVRRAACAPGPFGGIIVGRK